MLQCSLTDNQYTQASPFNLCMLFLHQLLGLDVGVGDKCLDSICMQHTHVVRQAGVPHSLNAA